MKKFYISFGQIHAHQFDEVTLNKDVLLEIEAKDMNEARERVFSSRIEDKFFTSYDEEQLERTLQYFPGGIVRVEGLS